jgi:hypothetical protein
MGYHLFFLCFFLNKLITIFEGGDTEKLDENNCLKNDGPRTKKRDEAFGRT